MKAALFISIIVLSAYTCYWLYLHFASRKMPHSERARFFNHLRNPVTLLIYRLFAADKHYDKRDYKILFKKKAGQNTDSDK
ncbi:hypothetical protein D9M68_522340 [compost metagenome]